MSWNAYIAVKGNGQAADWSEFKRNKNVEAIYTATGDIDWYVKLPEKMSDYDDIQTFVFNLRQKPWVKWTNTTFWKEEQY